MPSVLTVMEPLSERSRRPRWPKWTDLSGAETARHCQLRCRSSLLVRCGTVTTPLVAWMLTLGRASAIASTAARPRCRTLWEVSRSVGLLVLKTERLCLAVIAVFGATKIGILRFKVH